jgi:hypothetical protein
MKSLGWSPLVVLGVLIAVLFALFALREKVD